MDCDHRCDKVTNCKTLTLEELEKQANKTIEFPQLAVRTGNAIALFTMLVLQEILEQQAVDPITNLATISQLSTNIASLNSSIKLIQ